jgi:glucokinase
MGSTIMKKKVVGIEVDVKQTTVAVVDVRGNIIAKKNFATSDYPNINDFISKLADCVFELGETLDENESIRSVGISMPSGNFITGCIENASNLPWRGVIPVAAMLRDRLGMAVAVGNDAYVMALGEKDYGSAHGMTDFIVLTLRHIGVGSCIFSNGKPHLGFRYFAGEVGHTCVEEGGRQCGCGRQGCLETYTSVTGVLRTAHELLEASSEPSLLRAMEDRLTLEAICECCRQGDPIAKETFRKTGLRLGIAIANYASIFDPEAIILGGELTTAGKCLLDPLFESFEEHVFKNIKDKVKISISKLSDDERNVLGASALAWSLKEFSLFR